MPQPKPGLPGAIVEDAPERWVINGQPRRGVNIAVTDEQFEQYRQGYRCIRCHGVQPEPFPAECVEPFCKFRIKDDQIRFLESEFRGEHRYGPSPVEVDHEKEDWKPRSGIWLPRSVN